MVTDGLNLGERGMNRMMRAYSPDIFTISPNFFHTIFSYRSLEKEDKEKIYSESKPSQKTLSERQKLILQLLNHDGMMTLASIANEFAVTEKTIIGRLHS